VPEITRILCPIDFSDASRHAVDHAIVIAGWYRAPVTALHVHNPAIYPMPGLGGPIYAAAGPQEEAEAIDRLRRETAALFEGAVASGLEVEVVVEPGTPATAILDRAAALPSGLVVMGTHGTSGFEHLLLGSVTEKVLRRATRPVLTVPPRAQATSRLPFKRLLCPVDFSESSIAALELAFSFAQEGDAGITILHVLEWPETAVGELFDAAEWRRRREQEAAEHLERLVPATVRDWCTPATRVGHGKPYREILQVAAEIEADLIVIGVQGRNALDLMLFGSTTNQVIRRATCPVLTRRT
jgi:nucleotide-binding universal stress UspA family protein